MSHPCKIKNPNVENILALADFIDKLPPDNFDMGQWLMIEGQPTPFNKREKCTPIELQKTIDCGTAACIAGWGALLFGYNSDYPRILSLSDFVAQKLGIQKGENDFHLFVPDQIKPRDDREDDEVLDPYTATPTQAAHVLRHLAATGEINWYKMKEVK